MAGHEQFTAGEAAAAVRERLAGLPPQLFIDPELRKRPDSVTHEALETLTRLGILARTGAQFALQEQRRHPAFLDVADIVAFQAAFLTETLAGYDRLAGSHASTEGTTRDSPARA